MGQKNVGRNRHKRFIEEISLRVEQRAGQHNLRERGRGTEHRNLMLSIIP